MKYLYVVIFSLLIQTPVIGQNHLFIPFGQTKDEVRSFLVSRDYINDIVMDDEMGTLRAVLEADKHVEYVFKKGHLCATSVTRNYTDKKSAKEVEKKCLEYMQIAGSKEIKVTLNENVTCHTVVTENRVIKLFVREHQKSKTLIFTSVSRKFGPMISEKDYYYEINLFEAQANAK